MSEIRIQSLTPHTVSDWQAFVESHRDATFYHRHEWKGVLERAFGHRTNYLMAYRGGEVAGILPVVHLESALFGSIMCSMPFLNYGGVVAADAAAEHALVDRARELVAGNGADYLELRHLRKSRAALPSKTHKVSMRLELPDDAETLWDRFKSKHRREIRKAISGGFEARFGGEDLLDGFYAVLSRGWRDLGTPIYRKSFFARILATFGDSVGITLITLRGEPVATAFDGFFRDTVEGMWTFALRGHAPQYVNYFLYWSLIKRACERGFRTFHLGRSTAGSEAQRFKEKWKAVPQQLYWEYVGVDPDHLPELNVDNPKYRLAIRVWRNLPVPVTRVLGPFLARSIP